MDSVIRMSYRQYKTSYADCETVYDSYDTITKTVDVIIPEGRMKPSGVRGKRFNTIWLFVGEDKDHLFKQGFRAVDYSHALRQAKRNYKFVLYEQSTARVR